MNDDKVTKFVNGKISEVTNLGAFVLYDPIPPGAERWIIVNSVHPTVADFRAVIESCQRLIDQCEYPS